MKTPLLEAKNIKKWFPSEEQEAPLLQGINLSVEAETSYSIMGRSGAGKTTLLQILATLDTPSEGTLFFKGASVLTLDQEKLRNRSFGFVFQSFYLLEDLSVLDNVLLPQRIATLPSLEERALSLLDRCHLHHKRGIKASHLSGGEKQRVAIARALLLSPQILFLDEPTGSLDKENEESLLSLLFETAKEESTSLLLVTHNEALAERAHVQLILENGILKNR